MLRHRQQILWDRLVKCSIYLLKERNRTNSFVAAVKGANTSTKSRRNFTKHPHWSHLLFGRLTQKAPLLWHYRRGRRGTFLCAVRGSGSGEVAVVVVFFCFFVEVRRTDPSVGLWESDGRRQGGKLKAAGGGAAPHSISAGLRFSAPPPSRADAVLSIIHRSGTRTHGSLVPSWKTNNWSLNPRQHCV